MISELDMKIFAPDGFGPSTIRKELEVGRGMVVHLENEFVAYSLFRPGDPGDLTRIAVKEQFRHGAAGCHIGAVLFMRTVYNKGPFILQVRKNNGTAIRLYKGMGMTIEGESEGSWLMIHKGFTE
jgi:ribosomal protein S18 acetylase RimI-like enzyme